MTTADTRFARSAIHAASSSCSTATWSPASIVRSTSSPGVPGRITVEESGTALPEASFCAASSRGVPAVFLRQGAQRRRPGEPVLVELLDAVLAGSLAVDEAEEMGCERRLRA